MSLFLKQKICRKFPLVETLTTDLKDIQQFSFTEFCLSGHTG